LKDAGELVVSRQSLSLTGKTVHIYTTEAIVRTVVRHIADRPGMLDVFLSPKRIVAKSTRPRGNIALGAF